MQYACVTVLAACAALTAGEQAWQNKRIAEWSVEDARQILAGSPWVKSVTPTAVQQKVNMSPGGIGVGGVGIGVPGMGRRGGRGGRGNGSNGDAGPLPVLTVRWVSALPVNAAQLIVKEPNAPPVDEDHYSIAVYGLPAGMLKGDPASLASEFKKHAALLRDGKKDLKPSDAEVLLRDDGAVVVYSFPRSNEISRKDRLHFDAEIGRLKLAQDFVADEMVYQGRLEL